jgi:hypothetical protein
MLAVAGHALTGAEYDRHTAWRNGRLTRNREYKLRTTLEINAKKPASGGINLKISCRIWLYALERPHQAFHRLTPRHAIAQYAARRHFVKKGVIPSRKRICVMKADAPHGGRNGERHRDIIVERSVVIALAEAAVEMRVQFAQTSEALHDVGAHRTNEQPVHVE